MRSNAAAAKYAMSRSICHVCAFATFDACTKAIPMCQPRHLAQLLISGNVHHSDEVLRALHRSKIDGDLRLPAWFALLRAANPVLDTSMMSFVCLF